jgi:putative N-acetyltransferase (TIGR04045 family)
VTDPGDAPAGEAFQWRLARGEAERAGYFALRRQIFCEEQGVFAGDDRDACDDAAHPIVCLHGGRVVGVVRIWEEQPGCWWGGRLGVERAFRSAGPVGRRLVQTAVGTARGWGARQFRATVQRPNVAFFRRLHWRSLEEMTLYGQPHHLMEAQLARYPVLATPAPQRARGDADAAA